MAKVVPGSFVITSRLHIGCPECKKGEVCLFNEKEENPDGSYRGVIVIACDNEKCTWEVSGWPKN